VYVPLFMREKFCFYIITVNVGKSVAFTKQNFNFLRKIFILGPAGHQSKLNAGYRISGRIVCLMFKFKGFLKYEINNDNRYTVKKVCGSWNQKLYRGEYSGIYSLKLKNSGIYNLRFAPSWIYSWIFRKSFLRCITKVPFINFNQSI
jgi:hypothetical protein